MEQAACYKCQFWASYFSNPEKGNCEKPSLQNQPKLITFYADSCAEFKSNKELNHGTIRTSR